MVGFISLASTGFVFPYEIRKAVGCSFKLLSLHFFVIEIYHLLSPWVLVFRVSLMGNLVFLDKSMRPPLWGKSLGYAHIPAGFSFPKIM